MEMVTSEIMVIIEQYATHEESGMKMLGAYIRQWLAVPTKQLHNMSIDSTAIYTKGYRPSLHVITSPPHDHHHTFQLRHKILNISHHQHHHPATPQPLTGRLSSNLTHHQSAPFAFSTWWLSSWLLARASQASALSAPAPLPLEPSFVSVERSMYARSRQARRLRWAGDGSLDVVDVLAAVSGGAGGRVVVCVARPLAAKAAGG